MSNGTGTACFSYPADRCDVRDQARLAEFRAKRAEWVNLLEQDKLHSVSTQLSSLVWQDAVFRLFNEVQRLHDPKHPTASMASVLAGALTNGYVTGLVLGVSRLTDPKSETKKGDRNVVSLRRVFEDVQEHRHLITRENFVCYDGCVYDPHTVPPPSEREASHAGAGWLAIGGSYDWSTPTRLHQHFDALSGIEPKQRSRDDVIADPAFAEIEAMLSASVIENLRTLRNKVIAHAADPASRAHLDSFGFTLNEAEEALKLLCRAQRRVQVGLLWNSSNTVMPVPQFDVMEYMDQPFLREDQIEPLASFWEGLTQAREAWSDETGEP